MHCIQHLLQAVNTFDCAPFFYFHFGNAFESEDGRSLHVDLAAYEDPQILHDLSLQPLASPAWSQAGGLQQQVSKAYYKRLTIPLTGPVGGSIQVSRQTSMTICMSTL